MKQRWVVAVAVVALMGLSTADVSAQNDVTYGVRGGVQIDPDGVVFGGHANIPLQNYDHFSIEPIAMFGIGSEGSVDYTTVEAGARVRFDVQTDNDEFQFFVFGGLGIFRLNVDGNIETGFGDLRFDGSNTDIALQIGAGIEQGALGGEIVLGLEGAPDVELIGRYTFGQS